MLYRKVASEKASLNRDKTMIAEKLERKKQKYFVTKTQLEETTSQFVHFRD